MSNKFEYLQDICYLLCHIYIHIDNIYCLNVIQGKNVYTLRLGDMGTGDNQPHQLFSDLK